MDTTLNRIPLEAILLIASIHNSHLRASLLMGSSHRSDDIIFLIIFN
jgi:hypothetical protein